MARAGPSRSSQRFSQSQLQHASQSMASQSQSQRHQRRRHEEPEDEDGGEEMGQDDEDIDADLRRGDAENDLARRANDLVRLALFNEHKRTPLRREEISKKVLGSNSRAFPIVLDQAQEILRRTFGMELVELRSRAEVNKTVNGTEDDDDLDAARKAASVKRRASAAGSKTYILRSVLDGAIIEQALETDEKVLEEEMADAPSDDDDDEVGGTRSYGSIIAWNSADQLGLAGFLHVVLALVLVSGRVIGDNELKAYLKRLGLTLTSKLKVSVHAAQRDLTVDKYLEQLIRQGYLERERVGESKKGAKGRGKRARPAADDDSGAQYEWRWGNHAYSEIGEVGVAQFIAEFMVGDDDDVDDDEGGEAAGSHGGRRGRQGDDESQFTKMFKGIERAAGGELADLK